MLQPAQSKAFYRKNASRAATGQGVVGTKAGKELQELLRKAMAPTSSDAASEANPEVVAFNHSAMAVHESEDHVSDANGSNRRE